MNTPTVNVDPTATGPTAGVLAGQAVAVAGVTMHTSPVATAAWTGRSALGEMKSELTKTSRIVKEILRVTSNAGDI